MSEIDAYVETVLTPLLAPLAERFPATCLGHIQDVSHERKGLWARGEREVGFATRQAGQDEAPGRNGGEVQHWVTNKRVDGFGEEIHVCGERKGKVSAEGKRGGTSCLGVGIYMALGDSPLGTFPDSLGLPGGFERSR